MTDLNVEGMTLAPNVVETIVSFAIKDIEGVSLITAATKNGILSVFANKDDVPGIQVESGENGELTIAVHVVVKYGLVLPDIAAKIRGVVADAISVQVGAEIAAIDVYIDGMQFED